MFGYTCQGIDLVSKGKHCNASPYTVPVTPHVDKVEDIYHARLNLFISQGQYTAS